MAVNKSVKKPIKKAVAKSVAKPASKTLSKPVAKPAAKPATVASNAGNKPTTSNGKPEEKSNKAGFLQAAKRAATAWQTARTTQARELPTGGNIKLVPMGRYRAKLTAVVMTTKPVVPKGGKSPVQTPQVRFGYVITEDGEYKNTPVSSFQLLNGEIGWNIFSETLQRFGMDPTEIEIDDLPAALEELAEAKPNVMIYCKVQTGDDGKQYQRVYLNELLDDDGSEASEPTNESTEGESDEDEPTIELEVGMECSHPEHGECTITKIDVDEDDGATYVDLKDSDGKKHKAVNAEDLEFADSATAE